MNKVALKVAYIGNDFHGFQRQPKLRTVEGEIIHSLESLKIIDDLKESSFSIAGRTDRGVHSLGNVISFKTNKKIHINQINNHLPDDIQILAKAFVEDDFKARYSNNKIYRYFIPNNYQKNTISSINKFKEAMELFIGTHDFSNFSKKNERTPIRKIEDIIVKKEKEFVSIDLVGESFLWNMVRKIVRVMLDYSNDSISLNEIKQMLNNEREFNIKPMPPENLILIDVQYDDVVFKYDEYAKKRFIKNIEKELENISNEYKLKSNILKSFKNL